MPALNNHSMFLSETTVNNEVVTARAICDDLMRHFKEEQDYPFSNFNEMNTRETPLGGYLMRLENKEVATIFHASMDFSKEKNDKNEVLYNEVLGLDEKLKRVLSIAAQWELSLREVSALSNAF